MPWSQLTRGPRASRPSRPVAYTGDYEKHYASLNVETIPSVEGLPLSYLSSPRNCRTSSSDPGPYNPDVYGVAAFQNEENGELELYIAGIGGVYQYVGTSGTTDFVRMNGMGDLNTGGDNPALVSMAMAVGGNGTERDGVTALIKNYHALGGDQGGTDSYELRWYDKEQDKWVTVNTIPNDKYPTNFGTVNGALIMASDEVWTNTSYYNGKDWTLLPEGLRFSSFQKVNFTTAYATATNGKTYKWNADHTGMDDAWTEVDLGGKLLDTRYDGARAVRLASGGYAIYDKDGKQVETYPEIERDIFGDVWTNDGVFKPRSDGTSIVQTVGFGGDGNVYALIQGSGRNFVVAGKDGQWQLMDTVEAFDVGGTIDMGKAARFAEPHREPVRGRVAAVRHEGCTLFADDRIRHRF